MIKRNDLITKAMLTELGASCDQVGVFYTEWPDGARLTLENLNRANELELDVNWLANNILSAPAWAEYEKVRALALWTALE